jgi:hypothetical protein
MAHVSMPGKAAMTSAARPGAKQARFSGIGAMTAM